MPNKKREFKLTKFYFLAWVFGLLSIWCVWKNWYLAAGILLTLFIAYSRADYMHPPVENGNGSNDGGDSGLTV